MAGNGGGNGNVLPSDSRGHLHISITFIRPYALRMQPYAVVMHFLSEIEKPMKSRAESTCKEPYALYAPLLGVGPFLAFFLLRELHTVHTAAYGSHWNQALALLSVGIGASSARRNQKCIRWCIRLFHHATPYRPPIGNGQRNCPDGPASDRIGISTDPPHTSIFVGIVAGHLPQRGPYMPFFGPPGGLLPQEARDVDIAAIGPHRAAHGIWGSTRAEERRSVAASSHSPWLPPTHKALVTLAMTSRLDRRKGQGTTCPQRICLQAMRR